MPDLPPLGHRRLWFVLSSIGGAHVLQKVLTEGGNVHKLVVMIGAS